jgi:protein-tyrosine phosphatase
VKINDLFGTWRGLVRLLLSYFQVLVPGNLILKPNKQEVRRLVFVCHGNICRSAYADARARELGFNTASFGLSTKSGKSAHPPVIDVAKSFGLDLTEHKTCRVEDYVYLEGDYLLVMEVRHLSKLRLISRLANVPRSLLGLSLGPTRPHLHDPYQLSPTYMRNCLTTIDEAVKNLVKDFPSAKL